MQVEFAKALPLAVAVALVTACGKSEEEPANQATAPAATSAPATAAGGETVVKIDHAAPFTGDIAHLGRNNENGARLVIEETNKEGLTIDGKKIKLELAGEDGAGNPRMGTVVAQKLVNEHVVAVVGHLDSGVSIPASKIYSDIGTVQISPSSTNPDYTRRGFETTYRVVATDVQQGPAPTGYTAKTLGVKTMAIIDNATAYDKGLVDEFEKTAKTNGMNVVARKAISDKATDFGAILTKIKDKKPDVIICDGMNTAGGSFTKQAKELGITAKIVDSDGMCTGKVTGLADGAIDNIVCSETGLALSKMEKGADFEKKYQVRFNTPVQIYAPFTYDAVNMITDAIKRANSTDPTKILAAMPAASYNGVVGNIALDDKGNLKQSSIILYNYKDKKKSIPGVAKM